MNNLLILGAGQYGAVAMETAKAMCCFDTISFLDDANPIAIGKLEDYKSFVKEYSNAFIAIGNPAIRKEWINRLKEAGFSLPILHHPSAIIMPSAKIGDASIIEALALVNSNCIIKEGCIISAGAVINHNAVIENCCHIDCNAVVPARENVPEGTKVPCGAVFNLK